MATAVTSSIETKPVKAKPKVRIRKTRKRKKKGKNYYFNIGTEKAIIRYNKTDDARLKNIIYNEHIRAAFDNEKSFLGEFVPEGFELDECHMATGQTKIVVDGETHIISTEKFISWCETI